MSQPQAYMIGMGSYLPQRILSNQDLEKIVETSDEWIYTRTGMKERRIAAEGEYTSHMGLHAARKAMAEASLNAEQIDLILVATITPDHVFPSTAALIQAELGAKQAAALDIQAACTGFLYGLSIAKGFIHAGIYKNILLIASEKLSSVVDFEDRNTCVLFGDGAAACIVSSRPSGYLIRESCLGADGELAGVLMMPAGGSRMPATEESVRLRQHYIKMEGKEVFKHAVRRMENAAKECLEKAQLQESEIHWLVPHQANKRIIDAIAKRFEIADEKVYCTLHKYGNTSASAIAIALDELMKEKKPQAKENLLLVAFGAGFTWGAVILTKQ